MRVEGVWDRPMQYQMSGWTTRFSKMVVSAAGERLPAVSMVTTKPPPSLFWASNSAMELDLSSETLNRHGLRLDRAEGDSLKLAQKL
jgi:hypothetical protein